MFGFRCSLRKHLLAGRRVLLFVTLLLAAVSAQAATLTVTNTADSGSGSLRAAIANAASGDTIDFSSGVTGTITLTSGTLTISQNVTITGPGATALTISGGGNYQVVLGV